MLALNKRSGIFWALVILIVLVITILIVIPWDIISNKEQAAALKEVESKWQQKAETLLLDQSNAFTKINKEHKLSVIKRKKIVFETSLIKAIMRLQPKLDMRIARIIVVEVITECSKKNLDPCLITALIWRESKFIPTAHSNKGAVGLMQVRYSVWKEDPALKDNGVNTKYNLYQIGSNIKCGTEIFSKYYEEANYDIIKTLYRYNTGSKDIPKDTPDYTIGYINKILLTAYRTSDSIRKSNGD